jgi:hypothetical protein
VGSVTRKSTHSYIVTEDNHSGEDQANLLKLKH